MKKLPLIIIFLFFCAMQVKAQDKIKTDFLSGRNSAYFGLNIAPSYIHKPRFPNVYLLPRFENKLTIGIQGGYFIGDRIALETGIDYFQSLYFSENTFVRNDNSKFNQLSYYESKFYEFPLLLKLFLGKHDKNLRMYIPVGFGTRLLVINESQYIDGSEEATISKSSKFFFFRDVGLGLNYKLIKNIAFNFEPTLRLVSQKKHQASLPNLRLKLGMNYYFRK